VAGNLLDDEIEQLPPAPAKLPATTPEPADALERSYDDIFRSQQTARTIPLRQAITKATETSPDRAAEASRIGQQLGIPPALVLRNFDGYKKRAALSSTPFSEMASETPALAKWAEDPANAAIAHDDLEQLGSLEWLVTAPQRAFAQGINQVQFAMLRSRSIFNELTQEEHDQLESYRHGMEVGGELGARNSYFRKAVTGAAQQIPNIIGSVAAGVRPAILAGTTAGTAGFLAGPGAIATVPALTAAGATAGMLTGGAMFGFHLEAGNAYDEYLQFRDEFGQPLDPRIAKAAAVATGAMNAGLEAFGLAALAKTIPGVGAGVKALEGALTRDAVKAALRNPTIRGALLEAVGSYAEGLTSETAVEVAQRAVTILSGELAKHAGAAAVTTGKVKGQLEAGNVNLYAQPAVQNEDGTISTVDSMSVNLDGREVLIPTVTPDGRHLAPDAAVAEYTKTGRHLGVFESPEAATAYAQQLHADYAAGKFNSASQFRTSGDIATDLLQEGTGALSSFALTIAPGPVLHVAQQARLARQASANVAFFQALGEGVTNSKTAQRAPEAAQAFLADATKNGPLSHVYAPVDSWAEYWQGQGLDPAEMASQVTGSQTAWENAIRTGEDLAIPTSAYAVKLAGTDHNSFFANELRLAPDAMNVREAEAFQAEQATATEQQEQESPAAQVRVAVQQQLETAGVPAATAQQYATLYESAFGSLAERAGLDPLELFRQYGLQVERPALEQPAIGDTAAAGTKAEQPTAEFLAHGPDGPLYNIVGGDQDRSTVSKAKLEELGIAIPATPELPAGGERRGLSGDELRRRALHARAMASGPAAEAAIVAVNDPREQPVGEAPTSTAPAIDPDAEIPVMEGAFAAAQAMRAEDPQIEAKAKALADRARMSRRPAPPRARDVIVDRNSPEAQTEVPDGSELEASRRADRARRAAEGGVSASYPRDREQRAATPGAKSKLRRESPKEALARRDQHYVDVFADLLTAAREIDPNIDPEVLRAEFQFRVNALEERQQAYAESGHDPLDLLRTIAKLGGIGETAEDRGELQTLTQGLKFGRVHGLQVFAKAGKGPQAFVRAGRSINSMLEVLQEDARFAWIENVNMLVDAIDDAIRHPVPTQNVYPGTDELRTDVGINRGDAWWQDPWRPANLLEDNDAISDQALEEAGGDTSFNVDEFNQSLFDSLGDEAKPAAAQQADTVRDIVTAHMRSVGKVDPDVLAMVLQGITREAHQRSGTRPSVAPPREVAHAIAREWVAKQTGVDVLDTGEAQPRLPGAGTVRDQNVETPEFEAPFSLTAETAKPAKGKQTTLFQGLTDAQLDTWTAATLAKFPGLDRLEIERDSFGRLRLGWIIVDRDAQNQGIGTKVIRELTRLADENGERLVLTPAEGERDRLVAYYRRFGFVENARGDMVREPTIGITDLGQPFFHGSPHNVDKFSSAKVGTGQGAATYGHGLYFAENRDVATQYHKELAEPAEVLTIHLGSMRWDPTGPTSRYSRNAHKSDVENVRAALFEDLLSDTAALRDVGVAGFRKHVLALLDEKIADYTSEGSAEMATAAATLRKELAQTGALELKLADQPGGVYQVEIPDEHIDRMLDWDAPINKQPAAVQQLVREEMQTLGYLRPGENGPRQLTAAFKAYAMEHGGMLDGPTGSLAHSIIVAGEEKRLSADLVAQRKAIDDRYPAIRDYGTRTGPGSLAAARFSGPESKADFSEWMRLTSAIEKTKDEANKAASEKLLALGVPGIRYLDQLSRSGEAKRKTRNVVVFDDAIIELTHKDGSPVSAKERKEFLQTDETPGGGSVDAGRRGSIRFGADRQFQINLFERADLSTFLHESGHFFLEVLTDLAARGDANPRILTDYETLRAWLFPDGDTGQPIERAQHEQFARGFEAYLMEGQAPSVALRESFAHFRAWLIGIYKTLIGLKVDLTPEVRGVFDRLVASDRAIFEAEQQGQVAPMFLTAAMAGMNESEFSLYKSTVATASRTEREKLDQKLLADVQRAQTAAYREQRADVQQKVTAEFHERREYRAIAAMQRGTNPDGSPLIEGLTTKPMKLSRELIVERFGEDRLRTLPRPFVYTRAGGLDPNFVAESFGFSSGDELLKSIAAVTPLRQAIEQETERRMLAEHGSLLLDGSLPMQAQAALANEDRDQVIRAELRALGRLRALASPFVKAGNERLSAEKKERAYEVRWLEAETKLRVAIAEQAGQVEIDRLAREVRSLRAKARGGAATIRAAVPPDQLLRQMASERIARMTVRDLKPATFWSASRRAAQKALDSAARQEFDEAITAKQQELMNLALFREANQVLEDVAARVKRATALATGPARARIGLAGATYLEQVDGILDRYSFAKIPAKQVEKIASLRKWAEAMEAQGVPVDLPEELLDDARRIHYSELSVEELIGITDGLAQIVHLAGLKNRLLKAKTEREYAAVRDGLVTSITDNTKATPIPREFRAGEAPQKYRWVSGWFASHTKIATFVHAFDGYVDGGPMWEAIMRPINEAADAEQTQKRQAGKTLAGILEQHYPGRQLGTLNEKVFIPAINDSLSKEGRLAIALNWGNQTSRDRVLADTNLRVNEQQVRAILETLDERDWRFVQATWDYINTFWPAIAEKQQRLTGLAPVKVEALPVSTRFGEFAGGYYPLASDSRKSIRAGQHEAANEAKLATGAAYVRSTTKRGHTIERQKNVSIPLRLDLGVAFQHVEQVIHDLTHHEMLIDVTRLMRDGKVSQAILEHGGDIVYKQFTTALQDIAIGSTPAAHNMLESAANYIRSGTQLSMMGWNLWTALQQPLGMFNGAAEVGPVWVARGLKRWLRDAASFESTAAWIASVSPMMRERVTTATQDLTDVRAQLARPGGWFDNLVRTVSADHLTQQTILDGYLWHIGIAQRVADIPTWLGAYEKYMAAGEVEDRAIALADQAVINSQGSGSVKDLAAVQRGGPIARLFMTFYSYGNTVFNSNRREIGKIAHDPSTVLTGLGHLALINVFPAMGVVTLARLVGRGDGDDDAWFEDVGRELLAGTLNTMVLVRELAGLAQEHGRGYAGPAGTRIFEMVSTAVQQVKQGEADEALAKALNQVAGVIFRYPAAQVQRTVDGYVALQEGRTANPLALLMGGPRKRAAQ
jgi:GNAT superfamily N-acetyltransferase